MKKIISGKSYNTETAEEIASGGNSYPCNDFRWFEETLYKTKKGQYFVAGEGGAMSHYARPCGNMSGGGENLRLFSNSEARKWLEQYNYISELEEHFTIEEG